MFSYVEGHVGFIRTSRLLVEPSEDNTLTRDRDEPSGLVGGVEVEMEVEKEEGGSEEAEQMPGQLKGPWECDECGQSVKPPLESQYYF